MTEINKDTFWQLLAEAKARCGRDLSSEADYIQDALRGMDPEQALRFHHIMHRYSALADKYGLWSAASVMMGGCSSDRFMF